MSTSNSFKMGFAAFGFFVGSVAGLSTAELTTTLLALVFALIGGSVIGLLTKLDDEARRLAGIGLGAFGLAAVIALYLGIFIRANALLAIEPAAETIARSPLRGNVVPLEEECVRMARDGLLDRTQLCEAEGGGR